mgnify:CR=1 FL=1
MIVFERFLQAHPVCEGPPLSSPPAPTPHGVRAAAGGRSFGGGLYRIHTEGSSIKLLEEIDGAFPKAPPHIAPFGYDWLGRQFCAQRDDPDATCLIFELGTGEVLEVPVPFIALHDEELVDYRNEALASDFFVAYLESGGRAPSTGQCVGYRTPLFLGGQDDVFNLELVNLDVYWHLTGQLVLQTRGLPPGTAVTAIRGD